MPLIKKAYWNLKLYLFSGHFGKEDWIGSGVVKERLPYLCIERDNQAIPKLGKVSCTSLWKKKTPRGFTWTATDWVHQEIILGPNWSPKETVKYKGGQYLFWKRNVCDVSGEED